MRLYAIATSQSTSKGIGDNNEIEIELKDKNNRVAILQFKYIKNEPKLFIKVKGVQREIM